MKNEVKLNIHLFFPEQQNDEISIEEHNALEKLTDLFSLETENSVEKFIAELKSRLALIKPLLGKKTEKFLGYCQEDIVKIENFFAGKYEKFGMDAVAVQKILRSVWLRTPCEDKLLNYDLYDFIDKEFYSIINRRKIGIDFNDIPAPADNSWNTLKKDWMMRRKRYAEALEVDLEYLDAEAINGLEFPSASGLFANPSPLNYGKEFEICEFLNFWMPYILQYPFREEKSFSISEIFIYSIHIEYVNNALQKEYIPWIMAYKECFNYAMQELLLWKYNHGKEISSQLIDLDKLEIVLDPLTNTTNNFIQASEEIFSNSAITFLKKSKDVFCNYFKEYFKKNQPTHFWTEATRVEGEYPMLIEEGTSERKLGISYQEAALLDDRYNPGYGEIYVNLKQQLPDFINSCNEYIIKDACIYRSEYLAFYDNMEKINFFHHKNIAPFLQIFHAIELISISIPHKISQLEKYYKDCYLKFSKLTSPFSRDVFKRSWYDVVERIKLRRQYDFEKALLQYTRKISEENLSPVNKLDIIFEINNSIPIKNSAYFSQEMSVIEKNISEDYKPTYINESALINRIDYIRERDKNEKAEQQLKEAETKNQTQRKLFSQLNHSIKNLVGSVSKTLSWTKSEYELSTPVRRLINRASQGANLISAIANAISLSYRDDGDQWKKDLNAINDTESMSKIIQNALFQAIPNILSGDNITPYRHEYELYFPTEDEQKRAEMLWYQSVSAELKQKWINENLFFLNLNIDESVKNLQVGDEHAALTHFFIFFSEIFLNSTKAVAYVKKQFRKCDVDIIISNGFLIFDLKNSSGNDRTQKKDGFGHIIIENYCKKFEIKDFKEIYDPEEKMYKLHFKLPIILGEIEK